jgi:hypothetical protein
MNIARTLTEVELPTEEYIVVGSGVLDALGLREANDIDIVVSQALYEHLEGLGDWKVTERGLSHPPVEAFLSWDDAENTPNLTDLKADEQLIGDIPYVSLSRLRAWKERMGREKDTQDIALIDQYLDA